MLREVCQLTRLLERPHEQFVVVAARRQQLLIVGPLQTTYLLLVTAVSLDGHIRAPHVAHKDITIARTRSQQIIIPSQRANPALMSTPLA